MVRDRLIVVDGDTRRRAELVRFFEPMRRHVELYEAIDELKGHWPDGGIFIVQDVDRQVKDVIEMIDQSGHWQPLVAYSNAPSASRIVDCLRMGAIDYMDIPNADSSVGERLDYITEYSECYVERKRRWVEAKAKLGKLTPRELEILGGMSSGKSSKAIAMELEISPRTVEHHRANLMGKLNEKSSVSVIRTFMDLEFFN